MLSYLRNLASLTVLAHRGFTVVGGFVVSLIIVSFLSIEDQGYYFVLVNLLALQTLFEASFFHSILMKASKYQSFIDYQDGDWILSSGSEEFYSYAKNTFTSFLKFCVLGFFFIFSLGCFFLLKDFSSTNFLLKIWFFMTFSGFSLLFVNSFLFLLEGLNKVVKANSYRLFYVIFFNTFLCLFLVFDIKLYSYPLALFVSVLALMALIYSFDKKILSKIIIAKIEYNWNIEIEPLQKKLFISSFMAFLLFSIFTPLTFNLSSIEDAALLGLTLSILAGIISVSCSYGWSKFPVLLSLYNNSNMKEFFFYTRRTIVSTSIIFISSSLITILVIYYIPLFSSYFEDRVVPEPYIYILLCGAFLNIFMNIFSYFVRSTGDEPLVGQSISTAFLAILLLPFLIYEFGLKGSITGYLLINLFSFFYVLIIFYKFRNKWKKSLTTTNP